METENNIGPLSILKANELLLSGNAPAAYSLLQKYVQLYPAYALAHKLMIVCKARLEEDYTEDIADFEKGFALAALNKDILLEDESKTAGVSPSEAAVPGIEKAPEASAPLIMEENIPAGPVTTASAVTVQEKSTVEKEDEEGSSITEFDLETVATETLARILTAQQAWESAIQAYRILGRKFPEKNGQYEAEISKIEKEAGKEA